MKVGGPSVEQARANMIAAGKAPKKYRTSIDRKTEKKAAKKIVDALQKEAALERQHKEDRRNAIDIELDHRANRKKYCTHKRHNNSSNIAWHQHSNGIVSGVCQQCFSVFDAQNEDFEIFGKEHPKTLINMARQDISNFFIGRSAEDLYIKYLNKRLRKLSNGQEGHLD